MQRNCNSWNVETALKSTSRLYKTLNAKSDKQRIFAFKSFMYYLMRSNNVDVAYNNAKQHYLINY